MHQYEDLIRIFNHCFSEPYNTQLVRGDDEPIYLPATDAKAHNLLYFAHGFFSSALHETSHWLIAGEERRKLEDFGYWYLPDGRNAKEQDLFQQVEIKPQAMEWILSKAAQHKFRVSIDNLNGNACDSSVFKKAVYAQVLEYCEKGLPKRALHFRDALCAFYGSPKPLLATDFSLEELF